MTIQALLADDEPLARRKLRELLLREPDVSIAGEAATGSEVVRLVKERAPHVLFLDVRMPGQDGFETVDLIAASRGVSMPLIIFTTAYDQYAVRAFDASAVDYLLKPFSADRLYAALQRARETLQVRPRFAADHTNQKQEQLTRLVFKSRGRILFLPVSEIRWIAAEENYVRICTRSETHLLRETISSMEERLDGQKFLRVHRSAIVNLDYVKEVRTEAHGEFAVHLVNGQKVSMSRSYHSRMRDLLNRI